MICSFKLMTFSVAATAAAVLTTSPSVADVADFYKGKSISLSIGFGPGGGYDTYARMLARHFSKHIPGNPSVVPRNMPGGGGLTVANYLNNIAPRDGLHLAMFGAFTGLEPLFGNANARFDPTKFVYIGNMNIDAGACGAWKGSGIQTFEDLKRRQTTFGSSGSGSTTSQQVLVLKNMFGAKVQIVQGYKGSNEITLALRRGEVGATCGLYVANALTQLKDDLESGNMKLFIQFGRKSYPEFGGAVNIYDLVKTEEDRQVVDIIFRPNEIGRPVVAPPGIPEDIAGALREAFIKTMADPKLLDEAKKLRLPVNPMTGEAVTALFTSLYAAPKRLVDRAVAIMNTE